MIRDPRSVCLWLTFLIFLGPAGSQAQVMEDLDLNYYLPSGYTYNPDIPSPKSFLGFEIGEQHLSHDQLVYYLKMLCERSDRMQWIEYARTYENRPLLLIQVSSPTNLAKLEQIREEHLKLSDPSQSGSLTLNTMPAVVYQGFSIHGNEASGSNSVPLLAYFLAAAQGNEIENLLNNSVILVDPCLNPDGFQRFSTWVNMHRSENLVSDPNSREYNEAYPRGRTNHYWFDLNRDWLFVQHPESRGRIQQYQRWRPNVLTDHHEMGSNSTFFFQPGIPSRVNPLTMARNQELTASVAQFHARALDSISSLYYTKENYDDFYYGKGSAYPDIHGGIGILFEQASARGHYRQTVNGILSFPFAVRNQFNTALSTLRATHSLRTDLLGWQRDFYAESKKGSGALVFGSPDDAGRNYHFIDILKQHQIEVYELEETVRANGQSYRPGSGYYVPLRQAQNRLIEAAFQVMTEFEDSLFYDISTWTLPYAFNLPFARLDRVPQGKKIDSWTLSPGKVLGGNSDIAYIIPWEPYYTPRVLHQLQSRGLRLKVATDISQVPGKNGTISVQMGSLLLPVAQQALSVSEIRQLADQLSQEWGVNFYAVASGFAQSGVDLGSASWENLRPLKPLLLVGNGTSSYEIGEIWHLLDQRYGVSLPMIEKSRFSSLNLDNYNTIIMASGSYNEIRGNTLERLKRWLSKGNTLIGVGSANSWLKQQGLANIDFIKSPNSDSVNRLPYKDKSRFRGAQRIGGAIFEVKIDASHPLAFGIKGETMPLFKRSNLMAKPSSNVYQSPFVFTQDPLLSGYISPRNLNLLKGASAVLLTFTGRGKVISFMDDPNFRAFWFGSNRIFANSLFFSSVIEP